jgi:hypothetical protein
MKQYETKQLSPLQNAQQIAQGVRYVHWDNPNRRCFALSRQFVMPLGLVLQ